MSTSDPEIRRIAERLLITYGVLAQPLIEKN